MSRERVAARRVRQGQTGSLRRSVWLCLLLASLLAGCVPSGSQGSATPDPCPAGTPASSQRARVIATVDFGASTLFDEMVSFDEGESAMGVLRSVAEVETAYGGGFVRGINGTGSPQRGDWFYYVNGFMARTGAADYRLHDGDTVHWDFHDPAAYRGVSATLGSFPLAHVNGYGGQRRATVVVYEEQFAAVAADVASVLEISGASDVSCVELSSLTGEQKQSMHLIIIGGYSLEPLRDIYDSRTRLGLFTWLQDSELRTYLASGDEDEVYRHGTGVIEALQNPWNPSGVGVCQNVVLLLSGTDDDGVRAAARALMEHSGQMITWSSAIVRDGDAAPIPVPAR